MFMAWGSMGLFIVLLMPLVFIPPFIPFAMPLFIPVFIPELIPWPVCICCGIDRFGAEVIFPVFIPCIWFMLAKAGIDG